MLLQVVWVAINLAPPCPKYIKTCPTNYRKPNCDKALICSKNGGKVWCYTKWRWSYYQTNLRQLMHALVDLMTYMQLKLTNISRIYTFHVMSSLTIMMVQDALVAIYQTPSCLNSNMFLVLCNYITRFTKHFITCSKLF